MRRLHSTVLAAALVLLLSAPAGAVEPPPAARTGGIAVHPSLNVSGTYESNWGQITLRQSGVHISGTYVCCKGGTVEGRLEGNVIRYRWVSGDASGPGRGVWAITTTGELIGTWGNGESEVNGGGWNLRRPGPALVPASTPELAR